MAGRRGDGLGGRLLLYILVVVLIRSIWLYAVCFPRWVFGSRSLDPSGQIQSVLLLLVAVEHLWWQEVGRLVAGRSSISDNKAGLSFFGGWSSLAILACRRDARWSPMEFAAWLSRGKQVRGVPVAEFLFFSNKRLHNPPCFLLGGVMLVSFFSAGRGGKGEGGDPDAAARLRQVNLLLFRAQQMADRAVAMICGWCRSSHCFDGALSTSKTEAPDGVLGRRFTPPSHQVVRPRLLVAGGRRRDSNNIDAGGEDSELDCFSVFLAGSFLLKSEDQFVTFFFQGPSCNLYP